MIPLEQIRIASPCPADWDAMEGNDQARFCGECRRNVYNLSAMTRAEAEALVEEKEGMLCVRFYARPDGTVLTRDCPVGLRAARRKTARKMAYAAAVLLACASGLGRGAGRVRAGTVVRKAAPAIRKSVKAIHKADTAHTPTMGAPLSVPPAPQTPPAPLPHTPPIMGGVALPTHTMGMVSIPPHTIGKIAAPPHTMGRTNRHGHG